jgi:hypothetical protein
VPPRDRRVGALAAYLLGSQLAGQAIQVNEHLAAQRPAR